jgi:hypothetical protein
VYSTPISTLSKLCCTPKRDDDGPKIIPKSTKVCTRLKPIADTARITQSACPEECPPVAESFPYGYLFPQSEPKSLLKVHNTLLDSGGVYERIPRYYALAVATAPVPFGTGVYPPLEGSTHHSPSFRHEFFSETQRR